MSIRLQFCSALLAAGALFTAAAAAAPPSYKATFLDNHGGGYGIAFGLNRAGVAVGQAQTAPDDQGNVLTPATQWSGATPAELPSLGGSFGSAYGINAAGDIVGMSALTDDAGVHAVLWRNGQATDLGTLGGWSSEAYAINKAGVIVGESSRTNPNSNRAVRWKGGKIFALDSLGGFQSRATAINDAGAVVGWSMRRDGFHYAVRWEGKAVVDLHNRDWGGESYAMGINADGVIVGKGGVGGEVHALRWVNDVPHDLGTLGGESSGANAIADDGRIVGYSTRAGGGFAHAAMWVGKRVVDMNDWLDSAARDAGWVLVEAYAINGRGDVAGMAYNGTSDTWHGFVLTRQ